MALLGAMMKSEVAEEDFRIAKAKAKAEARVLAEEKFKEEKFNREMKEIHEHRSEIVIILASFFFSGNQCLHLIRFIFIRLTDETQTARKLE